MGRLTLSDIADLRAYERERDSFRDRVIALKRHRRISVGPIITLVFENRDTVRFQVQEMARAERMLTDEAISAELDIYNPLIPAAGELSATLFIELTTDEGLREWLPKLVGVEQSVELRIGPDLVVRSVPEDGHASQLTREDTTASVHYVRWRLTPAEVDRFAASPVVLAVAHPAYQHQLMLPPAAHRALLEDLRGDS